MNMRFVWLALAMVMPMVAEAGYVWNGVEGTAYDYAGTTNPPWAEDSSRTGKWIIDSANALTQTSTGIDSSQDLTVTGATYTVTGNLNVNSSLTIDTGGVVNAQKGLWMGKGNFTPSLVIQAGGTLNVSGNPSYLADNKAANGTIDVNGGTLSVSTENFGIGHHGGMNMTVHNGGKLIALGTVSFGAGDRGSASTRIDAVRVLTLEGESSTIDVKSFTLGVNSNAQFNMHAGNLKVGSNFVVGDYQDGKFMADGGTLTIGNMVVGNNSGSNYEAETGYVESVVSGDAKLSVSGLLNVKHGNLTLRDLNTSVTANNVQLLSTTSSRLLLENANLVVTNTVASSGIIVQTSSTNEDEIAELVIAAGGKLNLTGSYFWLSKDENTRSRFTIRDGGVFESNANSCLTDKGTSSGELIMDNGTYSTTNIISMGHQGYMKGTITNGSLVTTTSQLRIGGDNAPNVRSLMGDVTLGTEGTRDGSRIHANELTIGYHGSGRLTMYGSTIDSETIITVGKNYRNVTDQDPVYGDGELYATDSVITANGAIVFGENARAKVRIENSVLTASGLSIGIGATSYGDVEIVNSTLNIPEASQPNIKRGSLLLKGTNLTTTQKLELIESVAANTSLTIENATVAGSSLYLRNQEASGNYTASLILNKGGNLVTTGGMWMSNGDNARSYVEINKGGTLTIKDTSYLSDNRNNAYAKMFVNGGTMNAAVLNMGWWGAMDAEVANGGQIIASGITFNSNYDATTKKNAGDFTISGGGSLLKSTGTITFGNVSRDAVKVNLKLSDSGFGKIQAANINMVNGAYVFDAAQPFSIITDYVPGMGVLILDATGSLTGFTGSQTSGTWTATLSNNGKQVWATENISGLTYSVDDAALKIPESAARQGNLALTSGSDPFQLVFDLKGLADLSQTEALATALNETFDTIMVEASGINQLTFTGLDMNLADARVSWNFDALDAQFSEVQMLGASGNSVPEPATWLLLALGMFGIVARRLKFV